MTQVRVGLIGCGVIGQHHAAAAVRSDAVELVVVADVRRDAAEAVAAKHGKPRVVTDPQAVFDDRSVDAVVLALPANLRADLAIRAFKAGKHVLLEKPVARNVAELKRIMAAQGDRVGACCSMRFRGFASAQAITQRIRSGELGKLRVIRFRGVIADRGTPKNPPPPWRVSHELNGGGIFVNWGCYDLDYLLGLVDWNVKPHTVLAQCWGPPAHLADRVAPGSDADTHTIALVLCNGGLVLSLERAEFASLQGGSEWQIIGEKASLRLNMTDAGGRKIYLDQTSAGEALTTAEVWSEPEDGSLTHAWPLDDFARAILEGRPPLTPLDKALLMQTITDAVYQSARTGGCVRVQE